MSLQNFLFRSVCIADDDSDFCRGDIIAAEERADTGHGVLILTDMFGGPPSNLAIFCMGPCVIVTLLVVRNVAKSGDTVIGAPAKPK